MRDADEAQDLRRTFGEILGPYTDAATLFLVLACRALTPGGRAALVLPLSTLGARDAAAARREVAADCDLEGLWVARTGVFDAAVDVCAPILRRRSTGRSSNVEPRDWEPTLWAGRSFDVVGPAADLDVPSPFQPSQSAGRAPRRRRISRLVDATGSWSAHALPALGTPDPMGASSGKLGDIITTAAPFREEYYALVEHVSEAPGEAEPGSADWPDHLAALITSGSIGVGTCSWGERPTTFARTRRLRPVVDLTSLAAAGGRGAAWAVANAGPKVIVATQTRIGEAAVDETGSWMASTPAIVVGAEVGRLWDVAAAICSPVASVAGAALAAGTGRSAAAIRHTASTVAALPLPVDVDAWRTGADLLRRGQLEGFSAAMSAAHAVTGSDAGRLEEWWLARAT